MGKTIRIISRQSREALSQVQDFELSLSKETDTVDFDFELINKELFGDKHKEVSLKDSSLASDFFTRELYNALLDGRADLAVHSAEDLPYPLPAGIELLALTKSVEKRDSLTTDSFKRHPNQGDLAVTARYDSPLKELISALDIRKTFGKVTLVGFGPGDPELLTIKGLKKLESADVIFYDDLTNEEYLNQFQAEKKYVGKRSGKHSADQDEINELLYQAAIAGKNVVRLKGGDPMIFAHGREEIDYLKSRFVDVEVVPGISSGNALASLTQIPLTHRGLARSVSFVLGHAIDPQTSTADTLLYYMGGSKISTIAQKLLAAGRRPDTPVALVSNVSLPNQHIVVSTLEELQWAIYKVTPVLIVVGDVVGFVNPYQKVYNTGTQSETSLIKIENLADYDKAVFTSPSTVDTFKEIYSQEESKHLLLIANDKTTYEAIQSI